MVLCDEVIEILMRLTRDMAVCADIDGIVVRTHIHVERSFVPVKGHGLFKPRFDGRTVRREHTRDIEGGIFATSCE